MKYLMPFLLALLIVPTRAATPDEADFTIQYEVMNTSKVGSLLIGNFCTMAVRDPAKPNVAFILQKRGHGSCHVWDSGTILHGRREKNGIKLLVRDDKGKLTVENWPITGSVAVNPTK